MDDWEVYEGRYEKRFYDVRLPCGEIIDKCWPNAGLLHATDGSDDTWGPGDCFFRPSHSGD